VTERWTLHWTAENARMFHAARDWQTKPLAVLASGGLDSAALLAELAETSPEVHPLYLRFGLLWEDAEEAGLRQFLAELESPRVRPLQVFSMSLSAVYGPHWSTTGRDTPDYDSPDEAVFLPGRNLFLLVQPAVWCQLNGLVTLALGSLAANPFPDATPAFFRSFEALLAQALGLATSEPQLRIVQPYRELHKSDVLKRAAPYPIHATFSCIRPQAGLHCGQCNKCAERQRAFRLLGQTDRTVYAASGSAPKSGASFMPGA